MIRSKNVEFFIAGILMAHREKLITISYKITDTKLNKTTAK